MTNWEWPRNQKEHFCSMNVASETVGQRAMTRWQQLKACQVAVTLCMDCPAWLDRGERRDCRHSVCMLQGWQVWNPHLQRCGRRDLSECCRVNHQSHSAWTFRLSANGPSRSTKCINKVKEKARGAFFSSVSCFVLFFWVVASHFPTEGLINVVWRWKIDHGDEHITSKQQKHSVWGKLPKTEKCMWNDKKKKKDMHTSGARIRNQKWKHKAGKW